VEAEGLRARVAIQVGTLGKALGTYGAFVAGSRVLVDLLVNAARSFVYTTALPPPAVAAASAAVTVMQAEPQRRDQLVANAAALWQGLRDAGLQVSAAPGHIIPVHVGEAERTMRWSEALLDEGIFVQGIRPPTVPPDTARLRVTVMSTHTTADLTRAVTAFRRVCTPSV
jgi:7-keto-8-aminopelargonate synthetase-like enzyme